MTSTSQTGVSTITVYLRLNYDSNKALTEINTKVTSVLKPAAAGSAAARADVQIGQTIDAMYIGFNSDVMPQNEITDYLVRVVQPQLAGGAGRANGGSARRRRISRCAPGSIRKSWRRTV